VAWVGRILQIPMVEIITFPVVAGFILRGDLEDGTCRLTVLKE
jgi:hypothetical protein